MSDLKTAAEVAREIDFGLAIRKHNEGLEWLADYITARDLAVARRVIDACMHEVAAMKYPHDGVETRAIWSNAAYGDAVAAIRALDPAKILEVEE